MEYFNPLGRLSDLPLPLATSLDGTKNSLEVLARDRSTFPLATEEGNEAANPLEPASLVRLYTQEATGLPARQWRAFIKEEGLVHFHHGIYRKPADEPTPLSRAASLGLLTPSGYHHRIRYSRTTAAWVLGYLPDLPEERLHADYDRDRRCNLPRPYRASFATHQTRIRPFDTITIGPIRLTTPLKTALDLLTYSLDNQDLSVVREILLDTQNGVTPDLLIHSAKEQLQHRSLALLRAQHLANQLAAATAAVEAQTY